MICTQPLTVATALQRRAGRLASGRRAINQDCRRSPLGGSGRPITRSRRGRPMVNDHTISPDPVTPIAPVLTPGADRRGLLTAFLRRHSNRPLCSGGVPLRPTRGRPVFFEVVNVG
jgi:hypothetical protein